jgi:CHAT domain-containing protein
MMKLEAEGRAVPLALDKEREIMNDVFAPHEHAVTLHECHGTMQNVRIAFGARKLTAVLISCHGKNDGLAFECPMSNNRHMVTVDDLKEVLLLQPGPDPKQLPLVVLSACDSLSLGRELIHIAGHLVSTDTRLFNLR